LQVQSLSEFYGIQAVDFSYQTLAKTVKQSWQIFEFSRMMLCESIRGFEQ
jgi:hypothetical protein